MEKGLIVCIKNDSHVDPDLYRRIGICTAIEHIPILNKTILSIRIPFNICHVNVMLYDTEVDEIVQ
jgi:hypothetical protein